MSKFGEFPRTLKKSNADVAVVTEIKITAVKLTPYEFTIPGYSGLLRHDRSEAGGGIAAWIRNSLIYNHLDQYDSPDHEVLWFTVQAVSCYKLVFGAVYRPGSCADSDVATLENLDARQEKVRQHGSSLVLLSDINVHSEDWLGNSKTKRAGDYLEEICATHYLSRSVASGLHMLPVKTSPSGLGGLYEIVR